MSYAILRPLKVDVIRAIPPPPGMKLEDIPPMLRIKLSLKDLADAQADFERRALNDYYAEWFWFPYHDKVWINTWENTDDPKGAESYPGRWGKILQFVETISMQVLQNTLIYRKLGEWFALRMTTLFSRYDVSGLSAMSNSSRHLCNELSPWCEGWTDEDILARRPAFPQVHTERTSSRRRSGDAGESPSRYLLPATR